MKLSTFSIFFLYTFEHINDRYFEVFAHTQKIHLIICGFLL